MKRLLLSMLILLLSISDLYAQVVEGVRVDPTVEVQGATLQLNGYGIRKKYFLDLYLGSLYTARPVTSTEQALTIDGGKLIRMDFLYSKIGRLNIVGAFVEGIARNAPELSGSDEERTFISWFKNDFVRGDVVDLELGADGTVSARHNYRPIGTIHSPGLAKGVLLIYLGDRPADKNLKTGMLGRS